MLAVMADLTQEILDAAGRPASVAKGDASVSEHRLRDLVAAQELLLKSNSTPGTKAHLGLRFVSQKPPGAWE